MDPASQLLQQAVTKLRGQNFADALALFSSARAADPLRPQPHLGCGMALAGLGRDGEAVACFQEALRLKPDFAEAGFELGSAFHRSGALTEAAAAFEAVLRRMPDHVPAGLGLGAVLIEAGQPVAAEKALRGGLARSAPPALKAALHTNLALALRRQRKDQEALENCERALALNPAQPQLGLHRAEALQNLGRHDEAIAVFEAALAREPGDPALHRYYNDLLYRLGRMDAFLTSYDRAPTNRRLLLDEALLLARAERGEEAHAVYRQLLAQDPADPVAAAGAANALVLLKRHDEAAAVLDVALARHGEDLGLLRRAAEVALLRQDPERALAICARGLDRARQDQELLAIMSVGLRLTDDERDEALNGYESLIQVFDLEPPQGFSSMKDFNAELGAWLARLHPPTREYLGQSLRGGTQTPDHLFGVGHDLVDRLQRRIDQAIRRYVTDLREDESHPFLSRRARSVRYAGSWSSRLRDCGFHVNHLHPDGWISSCYYVEVPVAARDQQAQQGWIKFGEPVYELARKIGPRRVIQPFPGRLVLFPSYMWHGTIPFRSAAARTTIAFDVVPAG
jgi:tetratricopeptide (TPR) repeat protein